MKAIVNTVYGPPDVLQLKEVEKPVPKDNEVLIGIHATTVNRTDCGFRKPEYLIVRLIAGLFKPRKTILGSELAGVVESIGKDVNSFKPGDKVFGLSTYNFGAHAEYICIPESGSISIMPSNMSFEEAAAICDGLFLAMAYMRKIDFKQPRQILINGASGSIGTAGVQLAKHFGGTVTAVCKTECLDLVKSLGADEVIDYTKVDFTKSGKRYDIVFDSVGKSSFFRCKDLLKPKGIYFSSELGYLFQNVYLPLWTWIFGGKRVMFPIPTDNKADIVFFRELVESGKYKAVIDRRYRLDQIVEATRYVETGEKTGNVVIAVA
ncbi:MAG: NAD(P)-dependent alcohol dehydrogenase [Fibrobacterota bacterium]|nr:NAD(P)-dependent alcohol dehydrogenase [Fibrobacterota bacterium]